MSKDKAHTPGEWEAVLPGDKRGQPVPYYRGLICCVSHEEPTGMLAVVTADGRSVPKSEWEANAALIAAAPELLRIVQRVCEHFPDVDSPLAADARAALAKTSVRQT